MSVIRLSGGNVSAKRATLPCEATTEKSWNCHELLFISIQNDMQSCTHLTSEAQNDRHRTRRIVTAKD